MFLTLDDLTINSDEQTRLTAIETDAFNNGFAIAEAYLRDRLIHLFDMDAELAKTGTARRLTLVQIGVKIAQFEAYKYAPKITMQQQQQYDYDEAMAQLDQIEQGKLLQDLEPQEDEDKQLAETRMGFSTNNNILY